MFLDFLVFPDFPAFLDFVAFPGFHDFQISQCSQISQCQCSLISMCCQISQYSQISWCFRFFTRFLYKEGNQSSRNQNIMKKELLMLGNQFKMPKSYHFSNKCMSLCITLWFVKSLWGYLFGIVAYWEGLGQLILKDK